MPHLWAVEPAYPAPRTRRGAAAAAAAPGEAPLVLPQTSQIVLVAATAAANVRSTAVSRALRGPALIHELFIDSVHITSLTKLAGVSLRWAEDDAGEASSVAISTGPTGTPIFESFGDPSTDPSRFQLPDELPFPNLTAQSRGLSDHTLNYVVTASRFFLKFSVLATDTAQTVTVIARLTVYEGVDPEIMLDLFG